MGSMRVHDHLDDLGWGRVIGVDHLSCHLGVERRSLIEQLQQLTADIAEEQRTGGIETNTLHGLAQADPQPDHPTATQSRPGSGRQDRTATKGQDTGQVEEFAGDLLFECAERRLPIVSEDFSDRLAYPLDDDVIDITKGDAEPSREHGTDSALAGAGGTHQDDRPVEEFSVRLRVEAHGWCRT
jgi:hypothetical protein